MSDVIYKVSHMIGDPEFAINMAMHSLILFSFLSIFFLYYITTLAKNAFNQEITHLLKLIRVEFDLKMALSEFTGYLFKCFWSGNLSNIL